MHGVRRLSVDSLMQPELIVVKKILGQKSVAVALASQKEKAHKLILQRLKEPLDFAVGLRVSDRGPHVVYSARCHQFLKGSRDKLAAVIGDDSLRYSEEQPSDMLFHDRIRISQPF